VIFGLTREIVQTSTPNAERLVRVVAAENISARARLRDVRLELGDGRPAGLLKGLTSLGATAGGTVDAFARTWASSRTP
jgi:hypothetical protein